MSQTVKLSSTKNRLYSFDFMRALCAIGIIVFHFSCELDKTVDTKVLYFYANGSWGNTIVNVFFLISGAMLYYNNSEIKSLKTFYYKRIKSIFPMFYIAFILFYLLSAVKSKNVFFGGNPIKLLLSVVGLDGFFCYRMVNYYQVGEWFLGAIIILYALYPLILKIFKKSVLLITAICVVLYCTVYIPNIWVIQQGANLFSCLISFEIGMVLMKYKDKWYKKLPVFIISLFLAAIMIVFRFEYIPENLYNHLLALSLFVVMAYIGEYLMGNEIVNKIFVWLSSISFAIFLLQHRVICKMLQFYMPSDNNMLFYFLWLLLVVFVTIVLSYILTIIIKRLLKTKLYIKFEKKVLGESRG